MRHLRPLILVIGIFQSGLSPAQQAPPMVIVEPTNIVTLKEDGNYSLQPYRERRPTWGKTFAVSYSTFEPTNYQPNFLEVAFEDIYSQAELPMIELSFAIKRNSSWGSWATEFAVGIYQNDSDEPTLIDSSLQLIPIRLGATIYLDALSPQPLIVPYVGGGAYVMLYEETNNSSTFKGNTQPAGYLNGGVAFSLDWIDKTASRISYEDSGIEATYAFVEGRNQMAAGDAKDPDFSGDIGLGAGIRVEF